MEEWRNLLTASKNKWEQESKEQSGKGLEYLQQSMARLEEHETLLNRLRLENAEEHWKIKIELDSDAKPVEKNLHEAKATYHFYQEKLKYDTEMMKKYEKEHSTKKVEHSRNISKQLGKIISLKKNHAIQEEQTRELSRSLTKKYKLLTQRYSNIQNGVRHFASVNTQRYKEIWLLNEDKLKTLVARAVDLDQILFYEQELGMMWSPPSSFPLMNHLSTKRPHWTTEQDSEVEAYWENMANVIPESKLKVWEELEEGLKKYHTELTERAKLLRETQQLKQNNSELQMLLHQYQNSKVDC